MAMMTGDRMVLIEVSGVCNAMAHQTNYSIKIPYSSLSSTIQRITRQGGKIVKVTMGNPVPAPIDSNPATPAPINPSSAKAAVVVEPQKKGFKSKKK